MGLSRRRRLPSDGDMTQSLLTIKYSEVSRSNGERSGAAAGAIIGVSFSRYASDQKSCQAHACKGLGLSGDSTGM